MILKEQSHVRFIYSEKTTNFCEISTLVLSYVVPVKSKVEILQNYVAFSEYMNFKISEVFVFFKKKGRVEPHYIGCDNSLILLHMDHQDTNNICVNKLPSSY